MPLYSASGSYNVVADDITGKGIHSANGSVRVSVKTGVSYTGLHAADGSYNVVLDNSSTVGAIYHPCGALRVTTNPGTGFLASNNAIRVNNLSPYDLFVNSEQGAWYDPSDITTLFQDSAGTIPVTASEQPVGKMLDKSGRNNYVTQATAGSRPTYKVDAAGLGYLSFDGVDDFMVSPSIDFTGTSKMTVFVGVRKLTNSARGTIVELSTGGGVGSFFHEGPNSSLTQGYGGYFRGTSTAFYATTGYPFPISTVNTLIGSISQDISTLRVNGVAVSTSATDQGTGNFGNYPLYIGRRNGLSFPFNGNIYGLIVRGVESTTTQITNTERWIGSKTGVAL